MNQNQYLEIISWVAIPVIAFLYASVGHGGASSYLAILSLLGFAPEEMRSTALVLNIAVSSVAFYQYRKKAPLPVNLFIVLVLTSVPAAFLGGNIHLDPQIYRKVLGVFLFLPAMRLAGIFPLKNETIENFNIPIALLLGASIGFVSGLIGIGGGIILSPVILMLGWSDLKSTATLSALFIAINSVAGMLGNSQLEVQASSNLLVLVFLAVAGGMAGSWLGANYFKNNTLKYLLALVLVVAGIKLIIA